MSREVPETNFLQTIYGLSVEVNRKLPGVPVACESGKAGIRIFLSEAEPRSEEGSDSSEACYISPHIGEYGTPILTIHALENGMLRMRYDDGTQFLLNQEGTEIRGCWPSKVSFEDAASYLAGPVLGLVLHLRGKICLHASAVEIQGRAAAFVGAAGAGKSTTAAMFSRLGYPVLSDDVVAIEERKTGYFAQPGYARLCLTPEAARMFCGDEHALPAITPTWEKRSMQLGDANASFAGRELPLGVVYLLCARQGQSQSHRFEALSGSEALMELLANTFVQYFLTDKQRASEFPQLARFAARMPVRRFFPAGNGSNNFAELCKALERDFLSNAKSREANI